MTYNFDTVIDRTGTDTVKLGRLKDLFGREDLIPLWVADMDFETPDFIRKALEDRFRHPIYGYTMPPEGYWQSIIDWLKYLHGWEIERDSLTYIPGIVKGIGLAMHHFTGKGDPVIIQPPVYHPFRMVTQRNGRVVVNNTLVWNGKRYHMDLNQLEDILKRRRCPLLILSNPHNPGGCMWDRETLSSLARICYKYHVTVISDEIHADMPLYANRHIPFTSVSQEAQQVGIVMGAPSKTFNIAGLVSSFAVIPNPQLRKSFFEFLHANELDEATFVATVATRAAYTQGKEWHRQMLAYIQNNIEYVTGELPRLIPLIKAPRPDASFLIWMDCRDLKQAGVEDIPGFFTAAGLALNDGTMFGPGGEGFMRMNVACPRSVLEKAVSRLYAHYRKVTS
ncbi:MAG: PatB family C-S lyase [Bacteroidales bacterium]|jgi:cystathionine beta-lyase|nr:PatB family C-S lyase [Bacteroidales bacterium]MDD3100407.1 PatB family C-S lyase [Bacteroidales bacterium]MDD3943855.1 PatB family C-S lyase [Bacteroidales bacterium]MDD4480658.1 PatB family C-S lyase [Bacteroidales bacterium]MDD5313911.1 PatB family C-S lyase [Bacteroidales bacterium]